MCSRRFLYIDCVTQPPGRIHRTIRHDGGGAVHGWRRGSPWVEEGLFMGGGGFSWVEEGLKVAVQLLKPSEEVVELIEEADVISCVCF